jgi:DNA-directed RNA polymerase specialized sigma24 family protein
LVTIHEPNHTITIALETLPPFERALMADHFLDGASVHTLARRYSVKRRDIEATIEAALVTMRTALCSRGVRAVGDVI